MTVLAGIQISIPAENDCSQCEISALPLYQTPSQPTMQSQTVFGCESTCQSELSLIACTSIDQSHYSHIDYLPTTSPTIFTNSIRQKKCHEILIQSLIDSSSILLRNVSVLLSVAPVRSSQVHSAGQQCNFLWSHENWAAFIDCRSPICLRMADNKQVMKERAQNWMEKNLSVYWKQLRIWCLGGQRCLYECAHYMHVVILKFLSV